MVDKSWAEINSIREVYSSSAVLLCWFHVTQVCVTLLYNLVSQLTMLSGISPLDDETGVWAQWT